MLTGSTQKYIASLVAVFSLMLLIPSVIENMSLRKSVTRLENEKTTLLAEAMIKRAEVNGLVSAVDEQNKKITEFENVAKQMAAARLKAQQEAAQRVAQLNNRIAWLEQDKGASCNAAGIGKTILNEVLP
jgi:outer membrane murein-binding lipoprotein Lpp